MGHGWEGFRSGGARAKKGGPMRTRINSRHDRSRLLRVAKVIAERLRSHSEGTRIRVRLPSRSTETNTDGWYAVFGDLGRNQPRLELWLDRISGYPDRKFCACFHSGARKKITAITKRVSRKLWPVRTIEVGDYEE